MKKALLVWIILCKLPKIFFEQLVSGPQPGIPSSLQIKSQTGDHLEKSVPGGGGGGGPVDVVVLSRSANELVPNVLMCLGSECVCVCVRRYDALLGKLQHTHTHTADTPVNHRHTDTQLAISAQWVLDDDGDDDVVLKWTAVKQQNSRLWVNVNFGKLLTADCSLPACLPACLFVCLIICQMLMKENPTVKRRTLPSKTANTAALISFFLFVPLFNVSSSSRKRKWKCRQWWWELVIMLKYSMAAVLVVEVMAVSLTDQQNSTHSLIDSVDCRKMFVIKRGIIIVATATIWPTILLSVSSSCSKRNM